MSLAPQPAIATRLEKLAADNGFDRPMGSSNGWLAFASTQAPLGLWLSALADAVFLAAFSRADVARALDELGTPWAAPLPEGAAAGRSTVSLAQLHQLVRRAFQLARALPDEPLRAFERQTAGLPRTTEVERLVVQRIGQDIFRARLMEYWEERCAVTGLAVPELLRASHIKPWADCESDAERLDVFNGFLLAPNLDAAFDRGLLTFRDDGEALLSPLLDTSAREALAFREPLRLRRLVDGHLPFLRWHREKVFRTKSKEQ